jgi:hypothetical protein
MLVVDATAAVDVAVLVGLIFGRIDVNDYFGAEAEISVLFGEIKVIGLIVRGCLAFDTFLGGTQGVYKGFISNIFGKFAFIVSICFTQTHIFVQFYTVILVCTDSVEG